MSHISMEEMDRRMEEKFKEVGAPPVKGKSLGSIEGKWALMEFPEKLDLYTHTSRMETELIYREIFVDHDYDKNGIVIRDGDCIVDIGSHLGLFELYLARNFKELTVHAFEPIPQTFGVLQANMELNRLDEATYLYNLAVGADEKESIKMVHYPHLSGNSTFYPERKDTQWKRMSRYFSTEEINMLFEHIDVYPEMTTLSRFIDDFNIHNINLLKIDSEGSEMDVLMGIRKEHWDLIHQIVVEVHDQEHHRREVADFLHKHNRDLKIVAGEPDSFGNINLYCSKES